MPKYKQSGFTLVEIIVTITVFVIVLPAIAQMVVSLNSINDQSRELSVVHAAAQNKIEKLRSQGFVAVDNGITDFTNELPDTLATPRSASYTVSLVDPANPSLKQVVVDISYNNQGNTKSLKYKTYLGELGVGQY